MNMKRALGLFLAGVIRDPSLKPNNTVTITRPLAIGVFSLLLSFSCSKTFAVDGEGYIYHHEILSHLDKVQSKSPNNDNFDPVSGQVSFSATDISLPGNSALKVELRRLLDIGGYSTKASFSTSLGGFGAKRYKPDPLTGVASLEDPHLWGLDLPHIRGTVLVGNAVSYVTDNGSWITGKECSGRLPAPLPYSTGGGDAQYIHPAEHWSGITLHIPGEVTEQFLDTTESHPAYDGIYGLASNYMGSKVRTTKSNWIYNRQSDCSHSTAGQHQVFKVKAPDGRVYTFGEKKEFKSESYFGTTAIFPNSIKVRRVLLVTKVEDKFGNYVNYEWEDGLLTSINSNDGRTIKFNYVQPLDSENFTPYLDSAVAYDANVGEQSGLTWTYDTDGLGNIASVTLPDNKSQWRYDGAQNFTYTSLGYTAPVSNGWPAGYCPAETPVAERTRMHFSISDPDGLTTDYTFTHVLMARYNAPTSITKYGALTNLNCTYNIALVEKVMHGAGLPNKTSADALKWSYSYSENAGTYVGRGWLNGNFAGLLQSRLNTYHTYVSDMTDIPDTQEMPESVSSLGAAHKAQIRTTTVTSPTKRQHYYIHRDALEVTEGQILAIDTIDIKSSALLERLEHFYAKGPQVGKHLEAGVAGEPNAVNSTNFVSAQYRANLIKTATYRDDSDKYTTEFADFEFYGKPEKTFEYNNFSGEKKRITKQSYRNDIDFWTLHLPEKRSVSEDDVSFAVVSEITYQKLKPWSTTTASPLMPYREYINGETNGWQREYSFNPDTGLLSKIKYNQTLRSAIDTTTSEFRYQSFSQYYRGIPKVVTHPSRYNATTTASIRANVDNFGRITEFTDLDGLKTVYQYDELGRIKAIIPDDQSIAATLFSWNDISTSYDKPERTTYRCESVSSETCVGELAKVETVYNALLQPLEENTYDLEDNIIKQVFEYDNVARLKLRYYPTFNSASGGVSYSYDGLDRIKTSSKDGLGTIEYEYLAGNTVKMTDEMLNTTKTSYFAYGSPEQSKPTFIDSADIVHTTLQYNVFGNVELITQSDAASALFVSERHVYDSYRRLCKVTRPETKSTVYLRSTLGEIEAYAQGEPIDSTETCSATVNASTKVTQVYDNLGAVWSTSYADTTATRLYSLSEQGNLLRLTSGNVVQEYDYTGQHWVKEERFSIDGKTWAFNYGRSKLGHLSTLKYPTGLEIDYAPDALGQPRQAKHGDDYFAKDATYHANGSIESFEYGNGVKHHTSLTSYLAPEDITDTRNGVSIVDLTMGYYDNMNVEFITNNVTPSLSLDKMYYDALNRLTDTEGGSDIGNSSLTYDYLGNINTYSSKGRNLTYQYDEDSNMLSSVTDSLGNGNYAFTYDSRGNVKTNGRTSAISSFNYDLNNQITTAGSNSYVYDGHNRRVKSSDSKGITYHFYNIEGRLLFQEIAGKELSYIYLGKKLIAKTGDEGAVSSGNASHSRPFGESLSEKRDGIGYTGHVYDTDLGLNYMQQRYYDPVIGRFYSNDPVDTSAFVLQGNMHGFNRYTYANNNPYIYSDPNGGTPLNVITGGVGALIGGLSGAVSARISTGDWSNSGAAFVGGAVAGGIIGATFGAGATYAAPLTAGAIEATSGSAFIASMATSSLSSAAGDAIGQVISAGEISNPSSVIASGVTGAISGPWSTAAKAAQLGVVGQSVVPATFNTLLTPVKDAMAQGIDNYVENLGSEDPKQ